MTLSHPYHDDIARDQQANNQQWIAYARETARAVALVRGLVSSDDIWHLCPPPPDVDPRVMGAVFSDKKTWRKVSYMPSRRRECHGRPIAQWEFIQ